jgi:YD repeat-containing protein
MKHIEGLTEDEVADAEIETGHVLAYEFDADGNLMSRTMY